MGGLFESVIVMNAEVEIVEAKNKTSGTGVVLPRHHKLQMVTIARKRNTY